MKILPFSPSLNGFLGRIVAIPACVDEGVYLETEAVLAEAQALRKLYAQDRVVVTAIARLVPYKGIDVLLDAMSTLPTLVCFIAGDGPERKRLEKQAIDLGISDRCIFLGAVDKKRVNAILRASDIFVLPSVSSAETFAVSQVEAQLCGVPVIASDICTGVTDVTISGKTGVCVPPRDRLALAQAIDELASSPELRMNFALAGRIHAAKHFSFRRTQGRLLHLYDQLLQAGGDA